MNSRTKIAIVALLLSACAHSTAKISGDELSTKKISPRSVCAATDLAKQLLARQSEMDALIKQRRIGVEDSPALKQSLKEHSGNDVQWLATITRECGWPTIKVVGTEAAQAAAAIAIHGSGDKPSMTYLIDQIKLSADAGETPKDAYALMFDKIAVGNHQLQLYGTQADKIGGKLCILPVSDPSHLDDRRKAMNLPTMTEYLQIMSETFGESVAMCVR